MRCSACTHGVCKQTRKNADNPLPSKDDTSLDESAAYGKSFSALNAQYKTHSSSKTDLLKEREQIHRSLADTSRDLQRVQARGIVSQMQLIETQINLAGLREVASQLTNAANNDGDAQRRREQLNAITVGTIRNSALELSLQNQWLELDAAARLTLERRQKLLINASDVVQRAQAWMLGDRQLIDQYFDLADVAGTRSRSEREAALDVLRDQSLTMRVHNWQQPSPCYAWSGSMRQTECWISS